MGHSETKTHKLQPRERVDWKRAANVSVYAARHRPPPPSLPSSDERRRRSHPFHRPRGQLLGRERAVGRLVGLSMHHAGAAGGQPFRPPPPLSPHPSPYTYTSGIQRSTSLSCLSPSLTPRWLPASSPRPPRRRSEAARAPPPLSRHTRVHRERAREEGESRASEGRVVGPLRDDVRCPVSLHFAAEGRATFLLQSRSP